MLRLLFTFLVFSVFRLEQEREELAENFASVLQRKVARMEQERAQKSSKIKKLEEQKLYRGVVVSKQRHFVEVRLDEQEGLVVTVPRKWVKLGFGAYDVLERGDDVSVKYLGSDKVIRKDIFLVVASKVTEASGFQTTVDPNESSQASFTHLLGRDTWKEEK